MDPRDVQSIPLFAGLSKDDQKVVAQYADEVDVDAGAVLAQEGRLAYEFFAIKDGSAEVRLGGQQTATLGPGDFFGEIALLHDVPRTATVRATTGLRLHALDPDTFVATVTGHPASAEAAGSIVASRLPAPVAN
jgi:CRP-like cAMP-binding protein